MFKKLHRQLTFFCTLVTSVILITMSLACLSIAESGIHKNSYYNFLNELNSIISYLETQTVISHQWMIKMQNNRRLIIDIEDNGTPFFFQELQSEKNRRSLVKQAKEISAMKYGLDIDLPVSPSLVSQHTEFKMTDRQDRQEYYVSTAILPKKEGSISLVLLYTLDQYQSQILLQRVMFLLIGLTALLLLWIFSSKFTRRMLIPIEESRKRQVQFVAAASHELRSPLAVILSSLSAMKKAKKEEADRFSDTILSEGRRMSGLIDDMLSLASADNNSWSIQPSAAELDTLLLDMYEKYEPIARRKKINLKIRLPEEALPKCWCDKTRIQQVLSILIDNALSYTPEGGCVIMSTSAAGSRLELIIADNGPGIPDEYKKQVFERFYRVDTSHNAKNHFGLGLCIAWEIIRLHKGKLWIEDTPGGGASFLITLGGAAGQT